MENHSTFGRGTQAPSERHLEDWLWNNPEAFSAQTVHHSRYNVRFVERQVVFPSGVADLISADNEGGALRLYELKRGAIDARALAQLLRYSRDMHDLLGWVNFKLCDNPAYRSLIADAPSDDDPFFGKALIGHSIPDDILVACRAARVSVFLYQYLDGTYRFRRTTGHVKENYRLIASLADSPLGTLARDTILHWAEAERAQVRFDAAKAAEDHLNETMGGAE